jgi:flagella basal body P-ring formation protein FlgA
MRSAAIAALVSLMAGAASAQERAHVTFPVPAVAIQAGDTLTEEMIVERTLIANATALRTHHTLRASVVGRVARRAIAAGSAIPLNALREAHVFKEGERVALAFASGALSIRGAGIALQPGVVGSPVRVRNVDTGVIVNGVVRADGSVEIDGSGS